MFFMPYDISRMIFLLCKNIFFEKWVKYRPRICISVDTTQKTSSYVSLNNAAVVNLRSSLNYFRMP